MRSATARPESAQPVGTDPADTVVVGSDPIALAGASRLDAVVVHITQANRFVALLPLARVGPTSQLPLERTLGVSSIEPGIPGPPDQQQEAVDDQHREDRE